MALAGVLVVASACGRGADTESTTGRAAPGDIAPAEATVIVARHRAAFERFEAWAERTAASDATFGDARALDEVAFSPVRRDDTIVAAFIERDGGGPLALAHPDGATLPEATRFVRVAGADGIEVARATVTVADGARNAVALRRTRAGAGGVTLRVTVAFAVSPSE